MANSHAPVISSLAKGHFTGTIKKAIEWLEYLVEVSNTNQRQDRAIQKTIAELKGLVE